MGGFGRAQEAVRHGSRRAGAYHEAEPDLRGEVGRTQLYKCRNVGQEAEPLPARGGDRMQLAGRNMRQRRLNLRKAEQGVSGHEVGRLRAGSPIRHVRKIETEALVQLEAEEMRRRARAV